MKTVEPLRECDQCDRKDLKGKVALTMHKMRMHQGRNWSTRPKNLRLDPKLPTTATT